jgi:hypothetical protein
VELQVVRKRTHNPGTPVKPLADRLRPLFPKGVSPEDDQAIKHLVAIVLAYPSRHHELPAALLAIKTPLLEVGKWTRAMDEIGIDLGRCARTVDRRLRVNSNPAPDNAGDPQTDPAPCHDAVPDEITADSVEIATDRLGLLLTFHRRAETADEYAARSMREARRHFPQTKAGPHAGVIGYLLAQAANLGITAADLSRLLNTN